MASLRHILKKEHKKIISKGFKPPFIPSKEESDCSEKHTHTIDGPLLYDPERGMYYYGKNLSEAVERNYEEIPPSEKTKRKLIFNSKANNQIQI